MDLLKMLFCLTVLVSCTQYKSKARINEVESVQEKVKQNKGLNRSKDEIEAYLPEGFKITKSDGITNSIKSDLNHDGILDYILLMASGITDEEYPDAEDVRLTIFEGGSDGLYRLRSQTGNLAVYQNTTIKVIDKAVVSLFHQSMRHDFELKFRYEPNYEEYMLIGSEYNNYASGKGTGAGNTTTNFLAGERVAIIDGNKEIQNTPEELYAISEIDDDSIWDIIN